MNIVKKNTNIFKEENTMLIEVCGFSLVLGLARVGCVTYGASLSLNETTIHISHRFTKNIMVLLDLYY